jgi:hypothetical protein
MGTMKTPSVYIVEKNAFPNSVVEVATAVPALSAGLSARSRLVVRCTRSRFVFLRWLSYTHTSGARRLPNTCGSRLLGRQVLRRQPLQLPHFLFAIPRR